LTKPVIIGSRGSDLALWQANFFQASLNELGIASEIKIISTKGDRIQHLSFDKIEGKGFFTKEIEESLLNEEIDVAIHSHKDLETRSPEGLTIGAVSYRETPTELLLVHKSAIDPSMPFGFKRGAVVGTSSARRKSQIKDLRPDITLKDIRGNVPTRIEKLKSGDFDAILLATAGVKRLKLDLVGISAKEIDARLFIPAPAQGVLAFQCRATDERIKAILLKLHNREVQAAIDIERGILSSFGGGCQIPIGVHAEKQENHFVVRASFANDWSDFTRRVRFKADSISEALSHFQKLKTKPLPKSVFISKALESDDLLERASKSFGFQLYGKALIKITPFEFELPDNFDWIFFSSSNGVKAFFDQVKNAFPAGLKFGAYGEATAQTLAQYVSQIDFVASPGQPNNVAFEFKNVLKEDVALFPSSDISMNSIQRDLAPNQCITLSVYKTTEVHDSRIDPCEAYIFTSPSNVRAFHNSSNEISSLSKVIAIGTSTANALSAFGINAEIADYPHDAELFTLLCS
jgi:hydroxymethylbilane synthase